MAGVIDEFQNLVAVQGLVLQLPLMAAGLRATRKNHGLVFASALWLAVFLVMTLVFPFQGREEGICTPARPSNACSGLLCRPDWSALPAGANANVTGTRKRPSLCLPHC